MNTKLRIVVADEAAVRFYDLDGRRELLPGNGVLKAAVTLVDAAAHLHDRDSNSNRQGCSFGHASFSSGQRSATAHHGVDGNRRPREHGAPQTHLAAKLCPQLP